MNTEITKPHLYSSAMEEISVLIQARIPIIYVVTHEEDRFMNEFNSTFIEPTKRELWAWSSYQGLLPFNRLSIENVAIGQEAGTNNPQKALKRIIDIETKDNDQCFIMRDFHTVFVEPIPRQMRDAYNYLSDSGKTIIIVAPSLSHGPGGQKDGIYPTLEKQVSVVYYTIPNLEQIKETISEAVQELKTVYSETNINFNYTKEEINDFARACRGLTLYETHNALATSITHMKELNLQKLINEKRQIIKKGQILEFIDTDTTVDDIGGLDQAKSFLSKYSEANSEAAEAYGVEPLRGVLIVGIPGTGKSLLAKTIGHLWKLPLVKLDIGRVMGSLVGSSEAKMRDAISQIESISPCVVFLDEVEKSLSGTKSSNFSDGGTLARVFGTLLTAMQDGMKGTTLIATANDISMLPPEFIRRFNEVFFVDLPSDDERWDVLSIHLKKRKRNISMFKSSKAELLKASKGFTGAEIEKAVQDSIANAFYNNRPDIIKEDLLDAFRFTKPISVVQGEKISKMREAAKGQYRFASSYAETQASKNVVSTKKGKEINLEDTFDDMNKTVKTQKQKTASLRSNSRFVKLKKDN